jgi:hypothetical protein
MPGILSFGLFQKLLSPNLLLINNSAEKSHTKLVQTVHLESKISIPKSKDKQKDIPEMTQDFSKNKQ